MSTWQTLYEKLGMHDLLSSSWHPIRKGAVIIRSLRMKGHTPNEWRSQGSNPAPSAHQGGLPIGPKVLLGAFLGHCAEYLPGSPVNLLFSETLCLIIMGDFSLNSSCAGHTRDHQQHKDMDDSVMVTGFISSLEDQDCK